MNKLSGMLRRCVEDYNMIEAGETVAVGLSGGKDSTVLLCALAKLREYYPKPFSLHAITIAAGFPDMDFSPIAALCRDLQVPYTLVETDIREVVFDVRQEKNPCSLCAKMRRGALATTMQELGIRKIALGHHYDDAVETFLMSLLFEGRIGCFQPVTYLDRTGVTQIRPMLYVGEKMVENTAARLQLPVVKSTCPMDGVSRRQEAKELLRELQGRYPDLKSKVFGAIQRSPLEGWKVEGSLRRPLPEED